MITVSESLVTDSLMGHKHIRKFVLKALKKGKFSAIMAVGIFLPQNSVDLYELISLNEMRKPPYQDLSYTMVGLAGSRSEAIMLVAKLWMKENERRK